MDPLSITAGVIAILQCSMKIIEYANRVKDVPKERKEFEEEAATLNAQLIMLKQLAEENISDPLLDELKSMNAKDGPLGQYRTELESLDTKITEGGRRQKLKEFILWKNFKEDIIKMLSRIRNLKGFVETALTKDHLKLAIAIRDSVDTIAQQSQSIKSDTQASRVAVEKAEDRALLNQILDWIPGKDFATRYADLISQKQKDTGNWFLASPEYQGLLDGKHQTLFCPGIPGAGKTMLATIAIEDLHERQSDSKIGLAFIYCDYKSQSDQDARMLLGSCLRQLLSHLPTLPTIPQRINEIYTAKKRSSPSIKDLEQVLELVVSEFATLYIVIDALDECTIQDRTRDTLIGSLTKRQETRDVRLITTSRFSPEIEKNFDNAMRLEVNASKVDVEQYVTGKMDQMPEFVQVDVGLQKLMTMKIAEAVGGMFLLARLYVDSLLHTVTKTKLMRALDSMISVKNSERNASAVYDNAYEVTIKRIKQQPAQFKDLALNSLSWILHALRPLKTEELCEALAIEDEPSVLELDPNNVPAAELILRACAGLVIIDKKSNVVRLVHYTAQEYLQRKFHGIDVLSKKSIAHRCLTYLEFDTFSDLRCSDWKFLLEKKEQKGFLKYVTEHWSHHALEYHENLSEEIFKILHRFYLSSFLHYYVDDSRYYTFRERSVSPGRTIAAHLCVRRKFVHLIRTADKDPDLFDTADAYGYIPLTWSVLNYSNRPYEAECIDLVLERTSRVDLKTFKIAIEKRLKGPVEKMLAKGYDPAELPSPYPIESSSTLTFATEHAHGRSDIVDLLLRYGANIHQKNSVQSTAMHIAARKSYIGVIRVLVAHGCSPNMVNHYHETPLTLAFRWSDNETLSIVLESGVDYTLKNHDLSQLLVSACSGPHNQPNRLDLLFALATKRNMSLRDHLDTYVACYCKTPLIAAIEAKNMAIVEYLIENGADVNFVAGDDRTPLLTAVRNENEAVVELLIQKGASVNEFTKDGEPHLLLAVERKNKAIVERFILAGSDIHAQDRAGRTSFWHAASFCSREMVEMLIKHGANINTADNDKDTPLVRAVENLNIEQVHMLLEVGVDPTFCDPSGENLIKSLEEWMETDEVMHQMMDKDEPPEDGTTREPYSGWPFDELRAAIKSIQEFVKNNTQSS